MTTAITLAQSDAVALQAIAQQTGKSEDELVHEAVRQYIQQYQVTYRRQLLQQARGMWGNRTDLPALTTLREEFDQRQGQA